MTKEDFDEMPRMHCPFCFERLKWCDVAVCPSCNRQIKTIKRGRILKLTH